jgi:hypothetical protein
MFWLLSHKQYRILSLLILTEIMITTSLINKLTLHLDKLTLHLDISHKVISIKRCHHGMSVYSSISKFGVRIAGPSKR